jgi:hypothetical protein
MTNTRRDALGFLAGAVGSLAASRVLAAHPPADFTILRQEVRGEVVERGSAKFDELRRTMTWNPRVAMAGTPAAIVRVTSAQDVAAAVNFARAQGIKIAVRGGGHHYHGLVLRDDSLLLDLSALGALEIDAEKRRILAGPAVRGGALAAALASHGLAFPVGHCSDVCLSGFILNGGVGWNFGEWGLSCESVHAIEVVTANGEIVYADRERNPDLFWAARGAGPGFFGVVTRYDLAAYELPRAIHIYSAAFALDTLPRVAAWLPGAVRNVHPYAEIICTIARDAEGQPVIGLLAFGFGADAAEARARIASLAGGPAGASRLGETLDRPMSFAELFEFVDAGFPQIRMSGASLLTGIGIADLLRVVEPHVRDMPAAPSAIGLIGLGGGTRLPGSDGAFSVAGTTILGAYGFWNSAADDRRNVRWVDDVLRAAAPLSSGYVVGEANVRERKYASRCFSSDAWRKLAVLKQRFDPRDLFFSLS